MKKITFILLICFVTMSVFGQEKTLIDSSFQYLGNKYYEFKNLDSDSSELYASFHYKKALVEKDTIEMITSFLYRSELLKNDSIYINFLDSIIAKTKCSPSKHFPSIAHGEKGRFYIINGNYSLALNEYLKLIKYSEKTENDSLKFLAIQRLAVIKNYTGKFNQANQLYNEAYKYYSKKGTNNVLIFNLLTNLSSNLAKLKKYDSANFYNRKAYFFAKNNKDVIDIIGYSVYKQGEIEYRKGNYKVAIDSLMNSIPTIIDDENFNVLSSVYGFLARSYYELNNIKTSVKFSFLIDSLYEKRQIIHESQRFAYTKIINHYKSKNDIKNQLKYMERFLNIDSVLSLRNKKLINNFYEEYDKPKLIAERQRIIDELEGNLSASNTTKYGLYSLSGIILFLFVFQYRKRKQLKKRFEEVINFKDKREKTKEKVIKEDNLQIPEEVIEEVLSNLKEFENKKGFINSKMSLHYLANKLNTNPNYLSKIINHFKEQSFSQYINKLRINYVLELLDTDTKLRKYSIKGIATELGYKNAESFAKAFYKRTGLKPSYYIKQLEKLD